MRKVRTLRHWKQRFNKDASFIFRKSITYAGKYYKAGAKVPRTIDSNPAKLRRFWEGSIVELAQFEAPNVATGLASKSKPKAKPRAKKAPVEKKTAKPEASDLEELLA